MNTTPKRLTGSQLIRSMLLFFSSFLFAYSLNSVIIHEAGHAFGGVLFGCQFESLHVNPFGAGGWVNRCPDTMSLTGMVIQGMGGEIFGLIISIAITLLLWRKRSPMLLPLLMSATVVCIGNVFSVLDSLSSYPNSVFDYGWAINVGMPSFILWVIGIASLLFGFIFMDLLFPLGGIGISTPFWQVLILSLTTWPFFLALRVIYQSLAGRSIEGPISILVFGVILTMLTAITFKPVYKLADRISHIEPVLPSVGSVLLGIGLGVGLTILLVVSNPIWFGI
jgi:hypothetical protein